jgi:hypothetical protein
MKEKAIKALKEMGANLSLGIGSKEVKGFIYIVFIMQLYEEHGCYFSNMRSCFEIVAKRNDTTWENVMDCVNQAIDKLISNDKVSSSAAVVKYLGFMPKATANFLAMMYRRLKEEE